jgi:hypothetical protein
MQTDETTLPVSPHQPVDAQPALPNLLLGRTLDKTVESQHRRLLAVSIPKNLTRDDISRADEALDQFSLTFFSTPNDSLANAFGAALKAVKRPPKAALIAGETTGFDGGLVAAALDGQRLVVSAAEPGLVIVQQGNQLFSFPRATEAGDEFLDPSATIFETRLDPGDIVALLSGGQIGDRAKESRLTRAEVAEIAGEKGAWVWIELEKAKKQDSRHRAGLLSAPEPEAQRTWSTTAKPADPLWTRSGPSDGAIFQKPPALDSLNRYRNASGDSFSRSARTRLPRGRPSALIVLSLLLALLLVGSGFAYLYSNRPQSIELPDPEIAQHTATLAAALAGSDPAAIEAALPAAERALAIGKQTDLPPEQLAVLETEILQAHDQLEGVLRLSDVTLVGRLPESLLEGDPHLGESAGIIFVLDPSAFQLDLNSMTMLQMPFSASSSIRTFEAQTSADDVAGVVASDGSRLVLMGFDGTANEIGVTTWPKDVDPSEGLLSGFQNRLYLLDQTSGEIYVADGQDNIAYRWLADTESPLQTGALGMEINGAIHVVYSDGRLVSLSSGEVYDRQDLGRSSGEFEVLALDSGEETGDLYLATLADGTASLLVFDLTDGTTTQILLPPSAIDGTALDDLYENVSSLVVSETRGQIYWIADGAIWSAVLPEIPSAE